jgi:hypothetical protein
LFLIVFGFAFRYYTVYKSGADINILGVILSVIASGFIGGVGFYLGQVKMQESLPVKYLALSALFVFFMSHNLSNILGLYQLSWFAYLAVVCSLAFVTALRVPKMINKEKYS